MKWEYKVVGFVGSLEEFGIWLNEQGEQGWELCFAYAGVYAHYIFKRRKEAQ